MAMMLGPVSYTHLDVYKRQIYEVGASPSLYEVELNTTENQVTETVIYGNIQLVKHTDDLDPDVPEGENTDDPNAGIIERPEAGAVFEVYLKARCV